MKIRTTRITLKKSKDDVLNNATKVGCAVMMLPMGDKIKFTWNSIKYTIKREIEK